MNKVVIFLFSFITLLFSEDKILWDLGIIIKSNPSISKENNIIKPLISNTQIAPSYNTNIDLLSPSNISVESKHIMKILYLSNEYFKLTEYVKITQETNSDDYLVFNDEQLLIYADALSQIGNYNNAINNLNLLSDTFPIDEKYFLLAVYNKKAGNIKKALDFLNT